MSKQKESLNYITVDQSVLEEAEELQAVKTAPKQFYKCVNRHKREHTRHDEDKTDCK